MCRFRAIGRCPCRERFLCLLSYDLLILAKANSPGSSPDSRTVICHPATSFFFLHGPPDLPRTVCLSAFSFLKLLQLTWRVPYSGLLSLAEQSCCGCPQPLGHSTGIWAGWENTPLSHKLFYVNRLAHKYMVALWQQAADVPSRVTNFPLTHPLKAKVHTEGWVTLPTVTRG